MSWLKREKANPRPILCFDGGFGDEGFLVISKTGAVVVTAVATTGFFKGDVVAVVVVDEVMAGSGSGLSCVGVSGEDAFIEGIEGADDVGDPNAVEVGVV